MGKPDRWEGEGLFGLNGLAAATTQVFPLN